MRCRGLRIVTCSAMARPRVAPGEGRRAREGRRCSLGSSRPCQSDVRRDRSRFSTARLDSALIGFRRAARAFHIHTCSHESPILRSRLLAPLCSWAVLSSPLCVKSSNVLRNSHAIPEPPVNTEGERVTGRRVVALTVSSLR